MEFSDEPAWKVDDEAQLVVPFADRRAAGCALASVLRHYAQMPDVLVLALPRGGVPVGYEVAQALNASLDVFVVRKLGVPDQEELAMGAIASGGAHLLNEPLIRDLGITPAQVEAILERETVELERRESTFRAGLPALDVTQRTVIVVDDGLATGASMLVAARALRQRGPQRLVVGVPVAAAETCAAFESEVDEIVCAATPQPFRAVGLWYEDFEQTTDEEVQQLLAASRR
jgi:predicted phosphoribosyltransferase